MVQLLSGSNVDDFAGPYLSAVESFEKEAQAVFRELGGQGNLGDAAPSTDISAVATGMHVLQSVLSENGKADCRQVFVLAFTHLFSKQFSILTEIDC